MTMWCASCREWKDVYKETFDWKCPSCGSVFLTLRCTRCGHEWKPRFSTPPVHCSKCGSEYWNKRRMRSVRVRPRKNAKDWKEVLR